MSDGGSSAESEEQQREPAQVELLPLTERAEAYLAAERALRERLGLGGP